MRNNTFNFLLILCLLFLTIGCGNHSNDPHHNESITDYDSNEHEHDDHHELTLNSHQIKTIGLEFGDFTDLKVNDFVKATGSLGIPPNALTAISTKIEGTIKSTQKFVEGEYIKKGTFIASLVNPDLILKQQEYLETKAEYDFTQKELKRQKELVNANAGIVKNVEQLEAKSSSQFTKIKSLEKYLNYLGITTDNLSAANITERIKIYAPASGYISTINIHDGMYALPSQSLIESIDKSHLHLELDVFEKDVARLQPKQPITYTLPALGSEIYKGEVHVIGKEFDSKNRTVRIHGHLEDAQPNFIKDLFVNAKIWLSNEVVSALPDNAVLRDDGISFIYAAPSNPSAEEIEFTKLMVKRGPSENGFTAVNLIDPLPNGMKIVTKGAYYVYAQSRASELSHDH